jgi:hypothetical protein
MAISNKYCDICVKANVCEWTKKLDKLNGKDAVLDITVNGCSEHLSPSE